MKRILKSLALLILLLIIATTVFYFWASAPNLDKKEYNKLITYHFKQQTDNDSIYSIVTYNLGYLSGMTNNKAVEKPDTLFQNNLVRVKNKLALLNADIIAFQEIDFTASRSLKIHQQNEIAKLGYNYVAQAVNWDVKYMPFPYWPVSTQFGNLVSGQSILSKYKLFDHKRIVLERVADAPFFRDAFYLDRLAQVVKTTLENKTIVIINVHLEAFDKSTRVKQCNYVLNLFKKYSEQHPTILLGDFNSEARDSEAIIQKLFAMQEIGNAAFENNNIANTFNSRKPTKRIDYIFYTKNFIEYLNGKVLSDFGEISDHLPVYMEFKLK